MSSQQARKLLLEETKKKLLAEKKVAEDELNAANAALAAAKEKWKKNPYVKSHTTHEDRKDEISVFLAHRHINKDSVLRQKAELQFEREQEAALEREKQKQLKKQLAELKEQYLEERSTAKSVIRVELKESKDIVKRAANGKWTGTVPLSRVKGEFSSSKKGAGPKKLEDIPTRFPHSLFDRDK
jgi:phosphoenolpyruvate-protein kinase (PTS system EI component)